MTKITVEQLAELREGLQTSDDYNALFDFIVSWASRLEIEHRLTYSPIPAQPPSDSLQPPYEITS